MAGHVEVITRAGDRGHAIRLRNDLEIEYVLNHGMAVFYDISVSGVRRATVFNSMDIAVPSNHLGRPIFFTDQAEAVKIAAQISTVNRNR
ncbi:MAG: hypothetical protein WC069_03675 [Candidatus Shapirobacteria bacterium]